MDIILQVHFQKSILGSELCTDTFLDFHFAIRYASPQQIDTNSCWQFAGAVCKTPRQPRDFM